MNITAFIVSLIAAMLVMALSWGVTVGLVYLVCMCFGLEWSLLIGTGVWLVVILIRSLFTKSKIVEK